MIDHAVQEGGQPLSGFAGTAREFLHLGERKLGIGEREPTLGLGRGGDQRVELVLLLDLNSASLEQFQLAVEGAEADGQRAQDGAAGLRGLGQELNQVMEPRSTSERDVDRGASATSRPFHGTFPRRDRAGVGPRLGRKGQEMTSTQESEVAELRPKKVTTAGPNDYDDFAESFKSSLGDDDNGKGSTDQSGQTRTRGRP